MSSFRLRLWRQCDRDLVSDHGAIAVERHLGADSRFPLRLVLSEHYFPKQPPWYHSGIIPVMGMTLRPSDQQAEALRQQAADEGRSMQAVALSAIDEYIARRAHKAKVADALQRVVREEAGVLERLKDA
jgi:hypothetical protein